MYAVSAQSKTLQVRELFEVARLQNFNVVSFYRELLETCIPTQHVFADFRQLVVRPGVVGGVV